MHKFPDVCVAYEFAVECLMQCHEVNWPAFSLDIIDGGNDSIKRIVCAYAACLRCPIHIRGTSGFFCAGFSYVFDVEVFHATKIPAGDLHSSGCRLFGFFSLCMLLKFGNLYICNVSHRIYLRLKTFVVIKILLKIILSHPD